MKDMYRFVLGFVSSATSLVMVAGCSAGTIEVIKQAFTNGNTTHLVDPHAHSCGLGEAATRLSGLDEAQEYADANIGPSSVCYIEGEISEGKIWYMSAGS